MKTQTLLISLTASVIITNAQIIPDTVSIGTGYANEKWYSLQNDEQGTSPKNNWDIAFETSGMGAAIHINSSIGTKLWCYPNGDTSAWNSIDTSGINQWQARYNSDTSWSVGAFNVPISSNPYDLGWGIYSNITHNVIGDSIYIIKLSNNTYKKIWIKKLSGGTYYFQYADLNGNNLIHTSINKTLYNTKTLIYYSLQNNIVVDREPASNTWDIVFKQYTAFIPTPYNVTGVMQNKNVPAIKVYPIDTSYNQWYNHPWNTAINTIGYDWKSYSGTWSIQDSLVYFIKSKQNDVWKIVFKGFGGSANGNYIFTKEKISAASVGDYSSLLASFIVYPNPTKEHINIIYDSKQDFIANIEITDISGKKILDLNTNIINTFNSVSLNIENLQTGIYILKVQTKDNLFTQKIIKQ